MAGLRAGREQHLRWVPLPALSLPCASCLVGALAGGSLVPRVAGGAGHGNLRLGHHPTATLIWDWLPGRQGCSLSPSPNPRYLNSGQEGAAAPWGSQRGHEEQQDGTGPKTSPNSPSLAPGTERDPAPTPGQHGALTARAQSTAVAPGGPLLWVGSSQRRGQCQVPLPRAHGTRRPPGMDERQKEGSQQRGRGSKRPGPASRTGPGGGRGTEPTRRAGGAAGRSATLPPANRACAGLRPQNWLVTGRPSPRDTGFRVTAAEWGQPRRLCSRTALHPTSPQPQPPRVAQGGVLEEGSDPAGARGVRLGRGMVSRSTG